LAQAASAAKLLTRRGIRTIVSSPLGRAKTTAEVAAAAIGQPVQFDPELQEVAFGDHEAQPMLAAWFDDWVAERYTPPGGESFADLRTRAVLAVNRALALDAPVLIVAHGAVFRALRSAMGLEPGVRLANGTPFFCDPSATGETWSLIPANDLAS
ncbi:MAG: histidine phosphatase family protein, partial [Pseudomonadota bacterium]|nr:histidine phosphatase family protein [Pseudomonadota bacterium]